MTNPVRLDQLSRFVRRSYGASIQELNNGWKALFEVSPVVPTLAKITPAARLQLAKRSVTMARRLARDQPFARAVRSLADSRCAVCPAKFDYEDADILEVAHVRPVASRGPDDRRNALVLCPNHHALFDEGLWSITDDGRVLRSPRLPAALSSHLGERIPQGWVVDAGCAGWHRKRWKY